jgi:hypothetical protein
MRDDTNLTITIPEKLSSDFLGTMVIDILHDSKGRGILKGRKLHEITDLISESFFIRNEEDSRLIIESDKEKIKNWVFTETFQYIYDLWGGAQGVESDINPLESKHKILLPIKPSGENSDVFASLGSNRRGVECENFLLQKHKTPNSIVFQSPKSTVSDFYSNSKFFVETITNSRKDALVSLDMKSAAGLIRSTTDPIGYISSIATYADPGYNMAGMSAIRQTSKIDFVQKNHNAFSYSVNLETPFGTLKFFDIEYYWGYSSKDIRENLMIRINDSFFYRSLPKAKDMADSLERYLDSKNNTTIWSSREKMDDIFKTLYAKKIEDVNTVEFDIIYSKLHKGLPVLDDIKNISKGFPISILKKWMVNELNIAYIVSTIKLYDLYEIKTKYIFPEDIIDNLFPSLLADQNIDPRILFYIDHHLNLIIQYVSQPPELFQNNVYQNMLKEKLERKVGKCKLLNLRDRLMKNVYSSYKELLLKNRIEETLKKIIVNESYNLKAEVIAILKQHVAYFEPFFYKNITDDILKLSLLDLCMRLDIYPEHDTHVEESAWIEALKGVLGKFSGDFGQIAWCISTGNIFASEDNNSSAMACILHRVPKDNIIGLHDNGWVNIHGMGDGSEVVACFS